MTSSNCLGAKGQKWPWLKSLFLTFGTQLKVLDQIHENTDYLLLRIYKIPCTISVNFSLVYLKVIILLHSLLLFFPFVSLTNIAAISLERSHATFRPFKHRLIKSWVYVVAIVAVWVFPVITLVIREIEWFLIRHHLYLWESHCCLCLIVTFASYTSILFNFRFGAHPQRHCAAALRQRKLTVTLFITTLVSLLLWLPYNIYLVVVWLTDICNYRITNPEGLSFAFSLRFLLYANSLVNPILYAIRMPYFKKALLSFFRYHRRENVGVALNRH